MPLIGVGEITAETIGMPDQIEIEVYAGSAPLPCANAGVTAKTTRAAATKMLLTRMCSSVCGAPFFDEPETIRFFPRCFTRRRSTNRCWKRTATGSHASYVALDVTIEGPQWPKSHDDGTESVAACLSAMLGKLVGSCGSTAKADPTQCKNTKERPDMQNWEVVWRIAGSRPCEVCVLHVDSIEIIRSGEAVRSDRSSPVFAHFPTRVDAGPSIMDVCAAID